MHTTQESNQLIVSNLTKQYKELRAVNNVSFKATQGHPLAILGRNGAGKSTMIKMILGLVSPTSGEVKIDKGLSIGYLPEERGAYQDVSVEDHLKLFAKLAGIKNPAENINRLLKRFEITHYRNFPIKSLSKGNAQRVQLAIALINDPDLLILDEPLSGLDPVSAQMFQQIILEESKNKILITTSHNMNYVERLCENIVLINKGNVVISGEMNDIKEKYGKRLLELPFSEELMKNLEAYSPINKNDKIIIEGITDNKAYHDILDKINVSDVRFINYRYSSMEELFIDLLGENK